MGMGDKVVVAGLRRRRRGRAGGYSTRELEARDEREKINGGVCGDVRERAGDGL